jgi:tRNA dimethylallyltransferase
MGPTASGKTELALELAGRFEAEIVGADSRQIYRDMPLGTAAPTPAQLARVPHHLVAFLDPRERYSAARFADDALAVIGALSGRGKRVIVVGGTGFYVRALCGDVALSRAYDPILRRRLAHEAQVHPPEVLHAWLVARNPQRAAALAPGDRYRVCRALEVALASEARSAVSAQTSLRSEGYAVVKVALDTDAATLEARIAARVDAMLAAGFLAEAERVGADAVAADAVGYPQALAHLHGWSSAHELRALLIRETLRYAKRQRTWFRHEPHTVPIALDGAFEALVARARELPGWA